MRRDQERAAAHCHSDLDGMGWEIISRQRPGADPGLGDQAVDIVFGDALDARVPLVS